MDGKQLIENGGSKDVSMTFELKVKNSDGKVCMRLEVDLNLDRSMLGRAKKLFRLGTILGLIAMLKHLISN